MINYNQNGYIKNKMSERAAIAYDNGEMPISKWKKQNILDGFIDKIKDEYIELINDAEDLIEDLNKLTTSELKSLLLTYSSWHHTGSYAKETNFYSIDIDNIVDVDFKNKVYKLNINKDTINNIIQQRKPREKKENKEIQENLYITAIVKYSEWEGTRKHPVKNYYIDSVNFRSNDKMVHTIHGNKRLNNVEIIIQKTQKTKYYSANKLMDIYKKEKGI